MSDDGRPPHRSHPGHAPSAGRGRSRSVHSLERLLLVVLPRTPLEDASSHSRSDRRPRLRPHWPEPPKASRVLSLHDVKLSRVSEVRHQMSDLMTKRIAPAAAKLQSSDVCPL